MEKRNSKNINKEKLAFYIKENEASANLVTAKVLLVVSFVYFLVGILFFVGFFHAFSNALYVVVFSVAAIMFGSSLVAIRKQGQGHIIKYVILVLLLFSSFAFNIFCGYKAWLLFAVPIILSGRYYNRTYTNTMGALAVLLVFLSAFANAFFSPRLGLMDLNIVAYREPIILTVTSWLQEAVIEKGVDVRTVLINSLRLCAMPNSFGVILVTITCNAFIANAQNLMVQVKESTKKETELSEKMQIFLSALNHLYPFSVLEDFTNDSFQMIDPTYNQANEGLPLQTINDYVEMGASSIPSPTISTEFRQLFSKENVLDAYRKGKKDLYLKHPVLNPLGEKHWVETRLLLTETTDKRLVGIVIGRAIDDEQNAISHSDMILHAVTDDLICLIDVDLITETETQYFLADKEKLPSWSESHSYHQCISDYADRLITEDYRDSFKNATQLDKLKGLLETQSEVILEYDVVLEEEVRRFQGRFTLGSNEETKSHMYIGIRDITEVERMRVEEERRMMEAKAEAEASNKAKTTFLFNMSHDIRTPMNAILGFANVLEMHRDDEKFSEYVKNIRSSGEYLRDLLNNVLEMAQIESGVIKVDSNVIDLSEFLQSFQPVFEELAGKKHQTIEMDGDLYHPYIHGDATLITRVFHNILDNAFKFTPEGGHISIYSSQIPGDTDDTCWMETVVEDNGIGMDKEFLEHATEAFSRERDSSRNSMMGTGLGLAITRSIISVLGGTFTIESELGKGTRVTVRTPHVLSDSPAAKRKQALKMAQAFIGKRVLLAEDNDINAIVAEEILKNVGFEVERAADGVIAVSMLVKAPARYYDIVLMDIQMPNMDGYGATRTIRALPELEKAQIPIVAVTANAFEVDQQNAFKAGMDGHIAKPIDLLDMVEKITIALQKNI